MINKLIDILFPPVCVVCGQIESEWICSKCIKRIKRLEKSINYDVQNENYDEILYIFKYESLIRKLILQYKFSNKAYINQFFSKIILNNSKNKEILSKYDMIISVPMYKKKMEKRGYNQTELIAYNLSRELKIPVYSNLIKKIVNTKTQSKLNGKARKNNIKNAFFLTNELIVENKNIILFDDIFTTGATIGECSRILKKAGAKKILALTIAKD